MPQTGGTGDFAEVKTSTADVADYVSSAGELVEQFGFVLGNPQTFTANGTVPASASNVEIGTISGAITLTIPAASAVTAGHVLLVHDAAGSVTSSNTVALQTPAGGGKIGAVAANTPSTSAAGYAFLNFAYDQARLISNGTNWNPF